MRRSMMFRAAAGLLAFFLAVDAANALQISITSPADGDSFGNGATISVTGMASPNTQGMVQLLNVNGTILQSATFTSSANGTYSAALSPPPPNNVWPSPATDTVKAQDPLDGSATVSVKIKS